MAFILLKKTIPDKPPTLNTVIRAIAKLGGFLGRNQMANLALKAFGKECSA